MATEPAPKRVRVVLADEAAGRRRHDGAGPLVAVEPRPATVATTRHELAEQSQLGEALLRGLVRAQLGLALRLAGVVAVGLGGLPLLFAAAPAVARARPF